MGLWNYIGLPARDGPLLVFSTCCYTGTVHTIAVSLCESPLAIESQLLSLIESLLERATLREVYRFPSLEALADGKL